MKIPTAKIGVLLLAGGAAISAFVFRGVYIEYLTMGGADPVTPQSSARLPPDGTRSNPFVGQGIVQQVQSDERQLVLEHGEIPGLMGSMTMGYPVADSLPLEALSAGDLVEFSIELRTADPGYQIVSARPVQVGAPVAGAAGGMSAVTSAMFDVALDRQQLIGVRSAPVGVREFNRQLRTSGVVELDETLRSAVHSKISGWVEETFVDFQYQHVQEGDPLLTLYSPELVATQEEYLLALRARDTLGQSPVRGASFGAEDLVRAARRRLELWDVTPEQIARLDRTRTPSTTITIFSPVTGHVMSRNVFPGQRVTPDFLIYDIADHSRVWVNADVYETDIGWVRTGQRAAIEVPGLPGRTFAGPVTFVDPHVDAMTRTMGVRIELENPQLALKPGMYVDVELGESMGRRLGVPESAVLRTGMRDVVFVDHGDGRMEARNITLGARSGGYYEVLTGLQDGERVVVSGNFLIDAESRLQGIEPGSIGAEP